jgi:hypothetical protein
VRNKVRLIAQGFSQVEGPDPGERLAHVAHLEANRILLAFVASKGFKLNQMDVKVLSPMVTFWRKCLLGSPQVLRTPYILIECISFQRLCTGLSKRHRHGMLGLKLSC